ncbi:MAG: tRNA (adenosine(37)-N6)-threonylcarbamoyltransferase complex ATPase subunit type 1 TsaE [Clostridia bacterium]|nr:tRNA (adenosine(37)-N6)-threonylcarbamoyltransferase complex ATPase subunit type 1 TsaE [Clostridia bacterium]
MADQSVSKDKKRFKSLDKKTFGKHSAAYLAKMAMLTAIAFLLYLYVKFNLPFFPAFLDIQISELPALLAGFSMGPISGCLVVIFKCLLKFPLSSTAYVGEATDILLGIAFVLPASLIYKYKKDVKHALLGLIVGTLCLTGVAIIVNRFISIPFYVKLYFGGNFDAIVGMLSSLYKNINRDNFYFYYLLAGVLPFNIFRCIIVAGLTFALYKRLSKILHWNGESLRKKADEGFVYDRYVTHSTIETDELAEKFAESLKGGEIILLNGDLGAGKTTFTKGLAKALGVAEEVTSPTFTIMNVYSSGRLKLNHLDMYRVESEEELYELGVSESVGEENAVTVIEWNKLSSLDGRIISVDIKPLGETDREFVFVSDEADKPIEEPQESVKVTE